MSISHSILESGLIIRRSLFFILLILLTATNLFLLFRGLNTPQAMDQAQISREIARGNGFTTKFIRPAAYNLAETTNKGSVAFEGFQDTYHSPLNPLLNAAVLKLVGGDDMETWRMSKNDLIYPLDRIIAGSSTFFFLLAIGISYLTISRIFDAKIAGVSALLVIFSSIFWDFALSGLPQMLALALFAAGMHFAYRAVEASSEGKMSMTSALVAGVFFTFMALAHWMTVWIALGYIIFAAVVFRPRGVVAITTLVLILIVAGLTIARNIQYSGSALGVGYLTLYNGLGGGTGDAVMCRTDLLETPLSIDGLLSKVITNTIRQSIDIIPFLGGIIVAPLFFVSLLHPFKRKPIAQFRWLLLLTWISTAIGLSFFGVSAKGTDPNQLHILFAPLMTSYGLALICVLWAKLDFVSQNPFLKNTHHILIVLISAMPLLLSLPKDVIVGLTLRDHGGRPNFPPYYAPAYNEPETGLGGWVENKELIFCDQPWASAWYGDIISIWIPPKVEGFRKLEELAASLQTPCAGILITPSSYDSGTPDEVVDRYDDFAPLVLNGVSVRAASVGKRSSIVMGAQLYDKAPKLREINNVYRNPRLIAGTAIMFYTYKMNPKEKESIGQ